MSKEPAKPSMSMLAKKPQGLLRFGLRFPIWLYRLHLGWLFGKRFLLLTHIGRKSNLPRQTVIEIIRYDKATDTCVVASGWGARSDWYLNLQQRPDVIITLGTRKLETRAVFLSESDGAHELLDYARRHPLAYREITTLFTGHNVSATEENCRELAKAIPIVVFQPKNTKGARVYSDSQ